MRIEKILEITFIICTTIMSLTASHMVGVNEDLSLLFKIFSLSMIIALYCLLLLVVYGDE